MLAFFMFIIFTILRHQGISPEVSKRDFVNTQTLHERRRHYSLFKGLTSKAAGRHGYLLKKSDSLGIQITTFSKIRIPKTLFSITSKSPRHAFINNFWKKQGIKQIEPISLSMQLIAWLAVAKSTKIGESQSNSFWDAKLSLVSSHQLALRYLASLRTAAWYLMGPIARSDRLFRLYWSFLKLLIFVK